MGSFSNFDWIKKITQPNGQFMPIKSVIQFMRTFNDDEKCLHYLGHLKWGQEGWRCLKCGNGEYSFVSTRNLIKCKRCHYQESFIVNTIMEKSKRPLSEWFWTIYTIATQKTGLSAKELYRQMDFGSYQTAWTWLQKIRMSMAEIDRTSLKDDVEVDETYVFTGKAGRGRIIQGKKALIVGAVEVLHGKKRQIVSGRIKLRTIPSANSANLHSFIKDHVERNSIVKTDNWKGYNNISRYGYKHVPFAIDKPEDASRKLPRIHWVFSNLKSWLIGTHRFVSRKHLQNYLNEFSFRYNARYDPIGAFNHVLKNAIFTESRTYDGFTKPIQPIYVNPGE